MNGVQGLPGTAEANTESSREKAQKARRGRVATNAMKCGRSRNRQGNVCHRNNPQPLLLIPLTIIPLTIFPEIRELDVLLDSRTRTNVPFCDFLLLAAIPLAPMPPTNSASWGQTRSNRCWRSFSTANRMQLLYHERLAK